MEGVGARLGRSSTRYGPATVFTGPVRKWKKKWVHVAPSNAASHHHSQSHSHSHNHNNNNATINGNNGSHLLFYKWTPITQSNSGNNLTDDKNSGKDEPPTVLEETPRRKFKYIPIAVLEEQQHEAAEKVEDEGKLFETESGAGGSTSKVELLDEKPDINDVPMEESQEKNHQVRQDLNESTLDLSLNLNACDDDVESGSNTDQ